MPNQVEREGEHVEREGGVFGNEDAMPRGEKRGEEDQRVCWCGWIYGSDKVET